MPDLIMRRPLLFLFAIAALGLTVPSCQPAKKTPLSPADSTLYKACDYLWQQQSDDGAWHSKTHAILRGGESLTPFVMWALLNVPDSIYHPDEARRQKAFGFLRSHINPEGVIGLGDPDIMEYPNYSTGYALRILSTFGDSTDKARNAAMQKYLLSEQFIEQRGIGQDHLAYGSWGFGEKLNRDSITGHVDLSMTRRVLEGLKASGMNDKGVIIKARYFLRLVQKHPSDLRLQPDHQGGPDQRPVYDGGFYYSPVQTQANKAKQEPADSSHAAYYRSYATATCDGILALLAAGYTPEDEPVKSALGWLDKHPELEFPGGIPLDDPDEWQTVMKYYHLCVRSEALGAVNATGTWRGDITAILMAGQAADGSFSNPLGARNKEDDPMLATAFAVTSLRICREHP